MSAEVKKIRPEIDSDPQMILGMLTGYGKQIKHIAAVIIWEDGSYQMVNNANMKMSELAWALAVFQKEFFDQL